MNSRDPVIVAKILRPHGIHGEVVLESFTDVKGRLEETDVFLLLEAGKICKEIRVESRRYFNGRHVLKFVEISTRGQAEALRGKEIAIPESEIGTLPAGQYFIHDLIGMEIHQKDGRFVGTVKKVIQTGGVDLLELENGILIPFTEKICIEMRLQERQIVIDPPEGLLRLNAI